MRIYSVATNGRAVRRTDLRSVPPSLKDAHKHSHPAERSGLSAAFNNETTVFACTGQFWAV